MHIYISAILEHWQDFCDSGSVPPDANRDIRGNIVYNMYTQHIFL